MSRQPRNPSETVSPMDQLIAMLDLAVTGENSFVGLSPKTGRQRVFGGQVIAQALMAAQRTVVAERPVHSLHAYFLLPGDPETPIRYEVERIRDGGSFTTRRVLAIQHERPIFSMSASFQIVEDGFVHQIDMPDVPGPEGLEPDLHAEQLENAPKVVRSYLERKLPIEIRPVSLRHYVSKESLEPRQHVWVRATGPVPDDGHFQRAVLAWLSDMTLLDTSLYPHGVTVFDPSVQGASLDHAMWFHRPCKLDDWLLYTQDSPSASGARGMTRGSLFTRNGVLVASVAQEGLIRKRADA